jgi:pimeloyl-ACP methyl ester carboxylesterase
MVVGSHGDLSDEMMARLHEYSPVFDAARFAAHEVFFTEDVPQWARSRFGIDVAPERTAVLGVSASAELALAMGVRHPERYRAVFCASPGAGYQPPNVMPDTMPPTYLVAGEDEQFFFDAAELWAVALRAAGVEMALEQRPGTHGGSFWWEELPLMVAWAFG